jgi:hypothetical protein
MSDIVWLLWFEQEREEGEDIELLIGVYRTDEAAKGAIERLKDQPGFKDHPEGFRSIHVHWTKIRGPKDLQGPWGDEEASGAETHLFRQHLFPSQTGVHPYRGYMPSMCTTAAIRAQVQAAATISGASFNNPRRLSLNSGVFS